MNMSSCHLYAFLTVVLWSTSYVATKIIVASFSPGPVAVLRCIAAAAALAAVAAALKKLRPPKMRDLPIFLVSSLCGLGIYFPVFNYGMTMVGPTTSCVIISLTPVLAAVLASVFFKEHLTPAGWLAIAVSFCGILLMTLWDGTMNINAGVLWTLLAAVLFSVHNVLQRLLLRTYDARTITFYNFFIAVLTLLPFLPRGVSEAEAAPSAHLLVLAYLGVICSACAFLLWMKALVLAPKTSYVTNYMFITPFLALLLELAVLGQWPDAGAILGGLVILAGLALFAVAGKRKK